MLTVSACRAVPSELAGGFAVLPLERLVERQFGFVADGERDPTEAVFVLADQACRPLHAYPMRYACGDSPTTLVKRTVNAERDRPTFAASFATVHASPGRS